MHFHHDIGEPPEGADAGPKTLIVARQAARTVPWVMGILAAGMREQAEGPRPAQLRVLMALHARAMSPTELAERMQVSLPTISKMLEALERHGWVERAADSTDRRRVVVRMTAEGGQRMVAGIRNGVAQLAQALDPATEAELDDIERGLASLQSVLARSGAVHAGRRCGGHGKDVHGTAPKPAQPGRDADGKEDAS